MGGAPEAGWRVRPRVAAAISLALLASPERGRADASAADAPATSQDEIDALVERAAKHRSGVFEFRPVRAAIEWLQRANATLDERVALRFNVSYASVYQHATGADFGDADGLGGDFDLVMRWRPIEEEHPFRFTLGAHIEERHALTPSPPSALASSAGSLWKTVRGFNEQEFELAELWWEQRLWFEGLKVRLGRIDPKHFFDIYRFSGGSLHFLDLAFAGNPAIAFPEPNLGAVLRWHPHETFLLTAGVTEASGARTESTTGRLDAAFRAVSAAYLPRIEGLEQGRFEVTLWETEVRGGDGTRPGRGFSVILEQPAGGGYTPFLRYSQSDAGSIPVERILTGGVVRELPESPRQGVVGFGLAWGAPEDESLRDQYLAEIFYRCELVPGLEITPDLQVILHPSMNPGRDVIVVAGVRLRLVF